MPAGSGDVLFTPWLAGERSPVDDRHARGGFHNLSLATTRAHLVRAVLEGVAYNSRWLHDAVERFVQRRLDPVRIIGGGATSDLWCQIHADVMGRTIERVAEPLHANLRGAAMFAGVALGEVDLEEIAGLVPVDSSLRARAARHRHLRPAVRRVSQAVPLAEADVRPPQPSPEPRRQPSRPY